MGAFPQFLNGSFNTRSAAFDAQRSVNCFIEPSESGDSRSPAMLLGTPGLYVWNTLTGGGIRGVIVFTPQLAVVVSGPNVYTVTNFGVSTLIGLISNDTDTVSMASNGINIMLGAGEDGYFIDPIAQTVTRIVNDSFFGTTRVDFADGYFVFNKPDTGEFQITGLYNDNIDGLDFATAEGGPDNIISLIVDHRELWLLGQNTTEVWYNAGDPDFPFQRIQGAFLEIGCAAAQSVAKMDNSIFWLATDDRGYGTVQRAVGYTPQRVSNHAVEFAIASYGDVSDAVAYTYAQEGHSFYVLSFPSAGATWCLDASTNLWHERAWRNPDTAVLGRHRSNCQMNFAGQTIVGDWENGNLYVMDMDTFDDAGAQIVLIRQAPHITNDVNYVIHDALELTMQTGIGLANGQGNDPQVMLQWSDDGGYSWSNELWVSSGRIGATKSRVRWRRLGKSRDRVYRVSLSDPVRRVFTGASLDVTPCSA